MSNHRVPLAEWTKFQWDKSIIFVADRPSLASQGLAGASDQEFGPDDAMYFLKAKAEWGDFDNEPHGFGPVHFDIEIVFLDANGIVLDKPRLMQANTGVATPHKDTDQAIEAHPGWFERMGFQVGKPSPVIIRFRPHNPRDNNDRIYPCLGC